MTGLSISKLKINVFCIIVAFLLGLIYLWIQKGVVQLDLYAVGKALSLSIFFLVIPEILKPLLNHKAAIYNSSLLTITLILLLTLLGYFCKRYALFMTKPILVTSIIALIVYLYQIRLCSKQCISVAIWGVIFGLIFGIFVWGIDWLSPIFLAKVQFLGKVSQDSLFQISLANIFNTYNIPSTGLDGIPYVNYHWGSHALLASLSNLINVDVFNFYNIAYPIIFIPLYFKAILLLVQGMRLFKNFNPEINWLIFSLLIVFHFRIYYNPQLGLAPLTPFNSEPYLLGIIFLFLLTDILINNFYTNNTISKLALIIIPCSLFIISSMKISLGFLFLSAVFYLFFRYKVFKKLNYLIYFILLTIIFIFCFQIFASTNNERLSILRPLGIIRWFGIYYIPYYFFLLLLLSLILIFNIKDDFRKRLISGEFADLEVLVFIAVIGLIPGMIWYMSGNRHYFSDLQYWLSMILFLVYIPYFREKTFLLFPDHKSYKILKTFIVLLFINIFIRTINYSSQIVTSILKDKKEIYASLMVNSTGKMENHFLQNLKELSTLPLTEKKNSCIYINNSDSTFRSIDINKNIFLFFLVPAITGICSIEGIPQDITRKDFSFSFYSHEKSENRNILIEKARRFGFKKMFEINYDIQNNNSYISIISLN